MSALRFTIWCRTMVMAVVTMVIAGVVVGGSSTVEASYPGTSGRVAYSDVLREGSIHFHEVFTMSPDGSDQRRVTFDGGTYVKEELDPEGFCCVSRYTWSAHPQWSPDGSILAFLHYRADDTFEIRAVDPDGGNMRVLFSDWQAGMFTWSPDAGRIAYADERGVLIADADGTNAVVIAEPSLGLWPVTGEPSQIRDVTWSPDGSKLSFIEWSSAPLVAGSSYVTVVDTDGTNRISNVCDGGPSRTIVIDWAPDGRNLTCDLQGDGYTVMTVAADGSNLTPIATGMFPVWSPDDSEILYRSSGDLVSYDTATGATPVLLEDFGGYSMNWQPIQGSFYDDDESIFEADIEWLADEGITKGCNPPFNDRFCPDSHVTRGQMAAFLTRALGLTVRLDDAFLDDDDSIFESNIERLAAAGITKGCNPPTNDRYCPSGHVTRGQMAAFLVRALGYTDSGDGDLFIDDDTSIFEGDIDRLGTVGITEGCNPPTNNRYCPSGHVTRGQMAAFLHRALG